MAKRPKYPYLEVFTLACPHPRCDAVLEIPGCFSGEGFCSCLAHRIWVAWHDDWTPVAQLGDTSKPEK